MIKVIWHKPNIFTVDNFRFLPGITEISDQEWSGISSNPVVKDKLKLGVMEIQKFERKSLKSIVSDMSQIFDIKKLKTFLDDERQAVADAAKRQLEKIEGKNANSETDS
jgi:hypothetical protein